jgi:hypothetical protein
MKTIKMAICITLFSLFAGSIATSYAFESRMKQATENWLQDNNNSNDNDNDNGNGNDDGGASLRGSRIGTEGSGADPTVPIGDALPFMLLLAGGFVVYTLYKQRYKNGSLLPD